ncbi:MAG: hypothetical protein GWP05_06960 [Anaerolineaceae bacterium]|nr:hypothetical protein [Anaerolineaceae bacterium]
MAMEQSGNSGRIRALPLATALGIVWGMAMFLSGVATIYTDHYARKMVEVFGSIYWGYVPGSWTGALLGLVLGFADAFVGTLIIIGLYRLFCRSNKA